MQEVNEKRKPHLYWAITTPQSETAVDISVRIGYLAMPLESSPYFIEQRILGKPIHHYGGMSKAEEKIKQRVRDSGLEISLQGVLRAKQTEVDQARKQGLYLTQTQLEQRVAKHPL